MKKYIKTAIKETELKSLESTKEILSNHALEDFTEQSLEEYSRITEDKELVSVSFRIKGSRLFLSIFINIENHSIVEESMIEFRSSIYILYRTTKFSLKDMVEYLDVDRYQGWSIGDSIKGKVRKQTHTSLKVYGKKSIVYSVSEKIDDLLELIELKIEKFNQLALRQNIKGEFKIVIWNHKSSIEGFHLRKDQLKRITSTGLDLDVEIYVAS